MDWTFIAGVVITVLVAGYYYHRSSIQLREEASELRDETKKLRELNILTINILNAAGLLPENVEIIRDEAGVPTGFIYQLSGRAQSGASARGSAEVKRGNDTSAQETKNEEDSPRQE